MEEPKDEVDKKERTLLGRSKMLCMAEVGYDWREQESKLWREKYGEKTCCGNENEGVGW